MTTAGGDAIHGVQSVRRALMLLRLVATGQEQGIRLADLVAMSGLSRPTVHRLLKVLADETAVEQDAATRRYRVGTELSLLGLARGGQPPLVAMAEPALAALAAEVGDTVFLSLRHGADSVCVARHLGHYPIQVLSISVGARRALGASVSGIVLLAALPPAEARALTRANAPRLVRAGRDPANVLQTVKAARDAGHVHAPSGVMPGTAALSVPVVTGTGVTLAAISLAALADRLKSPRVPAVLAAMKTHAAMIAMRHEEIARARGRHRPVADPDDD